MDNQASELLEKIRQQFNNAPYPRIPLEASPKNDFNSLYTHNIVTSFYLRNQQIIDPQGKMILDAGCGTGFKSLILSEANPGAKVVGIDISEKSIELARKRLDYHGFDQAEFHTLSIHDLAKLGYQFDYINCDETLYLLPDPITALKAMKSVLKPNGIIRANLHNSTQRAEVYRAQKVFTMMGLRDESPGDLEVELVIEMMQALKNNVNIKDTTWNFNYQGEELKGMVLINYLLQGDKGYTIPEMFTFLNLAELEFINMVDWRKWDLMTLFKEPDNLPAFLGMSLPEISLEEKLQIFELLHPVHRLLDFWCGHPQEAQIFVSPAEWTHSDWQEVTVYLHPQLKIPQFKTDLLASIKESRIFPISKYLSQIEEFICIDSSMAICLIDLLDHPQSLMSIVERWKQYRPIDPVTLHSMDTEQALPLVQKILLTLEDFGCLLLERQV
ncbi:class I SAM-dependent methyltransferase [Cronbergia sp. UHCC 0137]|uniref:class I SAM-dependent methyltransferase n=1 Tax=Cronbergia sp. UHCC 0137 TaxID=3110239 RepID=UPI002B1F1F6B|nr:class I SAM-dependent methyltransferase [Cronbergia sp. UHCC 0137]MEA5619107.1 class I SAM-dependent methyltransferase [Cronbergia sp. UHCC 0137]